MIAEHPKFAEMFLAAEQRHIFRNENAMKSFPKALTAATCRS